MFRNRKKYLYIIGGFFLVFYILPNLVNFRERRHFSEKPRLEHARKNSGNLHDSISVVPGAFYRKPGWYTWLFGEKSRVMWTTPAKVAVFNYDTVKGGLVPYETGGSQQTTSIRLRDSAGRHWVLRSVNKDQKNVLPWWLQPSLLRPVFRDQVASMNPYAAIVVASLSEAAGIPHLNPKLYWVPFREKYGDFNQNIAGHLACLEEHPDGSWTGAAEFGSPLAFMDGEEMEESDGKGRVVIDTILYLRTRLFDMLVNDWDRHKDQWRWLLVSQGGRKVYMPLGRDRDIAFYVFDEGVISKAALRANEKFQSFRPKFASVAGLMKQSKKQDIRILKGVPLSHFLGQAKQLQQQLNAAAISAAFGHYPAEIYPRFGSAHAAILSARLQQLPEVARKFHELVNED